MVIAVGATRNGAVDHGYDVKACCSFIMTGNLEANVGFFTLGANATILRKAAAGLAIPGMC